MRVAQPALLRGLDVLHLYFVANHSRLYIRSRTTPAGSIVMRMYLGNKHFCQRIGDTSTRYEFQIDVK